MKIRIKLKAKQIASSLLVALVICSILSVSVVGYLSLTEQQNYLSARSQAWNMAIAIVEAGIEEGLEQLNTNSSTLTNDGWTYDSVTGLYTRIRTLPDGNSYTVTLNMAVSPNEIICRASVSPPSLVQRSVSPFLAAEGVSLNNLNTAAVSRAVKVRASKGALFTKAMVAKQTIDMNGNNVLTDSFDSGNMAYSWNGLYYAPRARDHGDVASNDTIINSVSAGNANIYGHVSTGPGGTVTVGSQGAIGPHSWQASGNKGIYSGWVSADSNFTFPDTSLPYNSGSAPGAAGSVVTTTFPVSTNAASSTNYPSPTPLGGVSTNVSITSVSTLPSPLPAGTYYTTNWQNKTTTYPSPGYYVGNIATNGSKYHWQITDFNWPVTTYSYSTYSTNTVYTTNTYDHIFNTGDYYVSGSLSGSSIVLGTARLVMPNGLSMSGGDGLTIAPGGCLTLYSGGTSAKISGNGVINKSGLAANFIMYCTPSVTSFSLDGNGEFTGVLVAPNVDIQMNGGGHSDNDFIGALIVNSVKMNGHYSFHYDEALGRNNNNSRLLITSWDEIQ